MWFPASIHPPEPFDAVACMQARDRAEAKYRESGRHMDSISHWGMFDTEEDDLPVSSIHHHVFFGGNITPAAYWEEKLIDRFPNGVTPAATPLMKILSRK